MTDKDQETLRRCNFRAWPINPHGLNWWKLQGRNLFVRWNYADKRWVLTYAGPKHADMSKKHLSTILRIVTDIVLAGEVGERWDDGEHDWP